MSARVNQQTLLNPLTGFSCVETGKPDHVWAIDRRSELSVPEIPSNVDSVVFSFDLSTLIARTVEISLSDRQRQTFNLLPGQPQHVELHILPTHARNVVTFETDKDGVKPIGDDRTLFFDVENISVRPLQKIKLQTIDELKKKIEAEIAGSPMLKRIRNFNHVMIEELETVRSLSGCSMLDVGGSIHGYALEAALQRSNVLYEGINLGVTEAWDSPSVEFSGLGGCVGRLRQMNAEKLDFLDETFDCSLSLSTFEHFLRPDLVLNEMHRVLRRGGIALINFDGVWSCSYGHHLLQFGKVNDRVPPWSHLFLSREQMQKVLERELWPVDAPITLENALRWIYDDTSLNRLGIRELKHTFERTGFELIRFVHLMDERLKAYKPIAVYLSNLLPWTTEELLTRGLSILLKKH